MAENTFTVDTTPQTETMSDNLTADEQDSLAVGEKIVGEQEQLLAGKYKDAQELEKAYVELQKKLGSNDEPQEDVEQTSATEETEETSLSDGASLISSANDEYYANDGKLSEETLEKFSGLSSKELVEAYLEVQNTDAFKANTQDVADLSDSDINTIKNFAGGESQYDNIIAWANTNLDAKSQEAFDSIVNTGSVDAIKIAVSGLKSQYEAANGYEGKMYTGKAPKGNTDVFRSQAELVAAMNDKRYDRDPAYRQDVIEKLDRSDLEF
jgi:hypothetical protein